MQLENQVTSLQLSEELKEAGVPQKSLFYWAINPGNGNAIIVYHFNRTGKGMLVSAFTVAEIGEILSNNKDVFDNLKSDKLPQDIQDITDGHLLDFNFSADYWGKMLLYLLKEKLITLTTLNNK